MSKIPIVEVAHEGGEEEEEGTTKGEVARTEELIVAKEPKAETIMTEGLEELAITYEVQT